MRARHGRSGWPRTSGLLGFNQALCHLSYRPVSRDAATRTPFLLVPGQAGHHIPFIPVDRVGFEPDNLLLAGQALYQLELAAHVADDPGHARRQWPGSLARTALACRA